MFRRELKQPLAPLVAVLLVSTTILLFYQWYLAQSLRPLYRDDESRLGVDSSAKLVEPATLKGRKLPEAIVVGARKSGTRALLKFLEINPQVSSAHNEVHFFDKPQNYKLGLEWYREQMPESNYDSLTIEKSPAYFVTKGVPERMKQMNPDVKLILVLRDPVERLISDFSQLIANRISQSREDLNNGSAQSSVDKLVNISENDIWNRAKQKFRDYVLRRDGGIDDRRTAIRTGMYSVHLERWLFYFNMSQIHIVDGETLIRNPYKELHKVELFLSLVPKIRPEDFVYNPQKGFYCIASSAVSRRSSVTNSTISCLSKSKGRRHVQVDEDLVIKLSKFYQPYNDYLYSITGRRFDWNV